VSLVSADTLLATLHVVMTWQWCSSTSTVLWMYLCQWCPRRWRREVHM